MVSQPSPTRNRKSTCGAADRAFATAPFTGCGSTQ
jgi:hypothetical protein